jgi:hypothetical protein
VNEIANKAQEISFPVVNRAPPSIYKECQIIITINRTCPGICVSNYVKISEKVRDIAPNLFVGSFTVSSIKQNRQFTMCVSLEGHRLSNNILRGLSPKANYTYRRRLTAKLMPTFVDKGCCVVSIKDPYGRILGFIDRSRYFWTQIVTYIKESCTWSIYVRISVSMEAGFFFLQYLTVQIDVPLFMELKVHYHIYE